jgi:hypothetical protein
MYPNEVHILEYVNLKIYNLFRTLDIFLKYPYLK